MKKRLLSAGAAVALITGAFAVPALAQDPVASPGLPGESIMPGNGEPSPFGSFAPVDADQPHPAHIHDGLCPEPGEVAKPLSDLVIGTDQAVGVPSAVPVEVSASRVDMSLDDILSAERSINVHESADAMDAYIACGDIGGQMLGDDALAIGLSELNGSGHRGVAWLQDNGDGSTNVQVFLINESFLDGDPGQGGVDASMEPGQSMAPGASMAPDQTTVPVTTTVPQETIVPQPTTIPSEVPVMTTVPSEVPAMTTVPAGSPAPAESAAPAS
jgi:hypothetical protein